MTNVIAFTPRPRPTEPVQPPLPAIDIRTHLEGAAQTALDAADKIIAALDQIEGGEALRLREPLAPVEPISQDLPLVEDDLTDEETIAPDLIAKPIVLPWRGAGNVVSAAGCAFLALVARA